jgi:hypothetical protein
VFEFAVRDTTTLQWLSTAELLDLPAQLVADVPEVANVRPATATNKDGNGSTALVAATSASCMLLLVALLIAVRKRQRRTLVAASTQQDKFGLYANPLYSQPGLKEDEPFELHPNPLYTSHEPQHSLYCEPETCNSHDRLMSSTGAVLALKGYEQLTEAVM